MNLNGESYTVVGVMPRTAELPSMEFGVSATDPLTFVTISLGFSASRYWPAHPFRVRDEKSIDGGTALPVVA